MVGTFSIVDTMMVLIPSILGATAFWNYLGKREDRVKKDQARKLSEGLRDIAGIYKMMGEMENFGANRVVLFAGHNGGGVPRITCGFWTSSIFAHYSEKYQDRAKQYNNIPVDSSYVNMLIEAQSRPYVRHRQSDAIPSQLTKLYEAEGVVDSLIFSLGIHEQKFMYMSVASYEREFTDNEITYIELQAQNIQSLFDKLDRTY